MSRSTPSKPIPGNLSLYLDFLRLMAACAVFFSHARNFLFPQIDLGFWDEGKEAVAVFFVLSGFVISHVVDCKEKDYKSYAVARMARIYPVAVLAVFITLAADSIGTLFYAPYYAALDGLHNGFYQKTNFVSALSYLGFFNQIWFTHSIFGTDEPYWSLGFEVPYYIFFGLISFLPGKKKLAGGLVWALICGPKIIQYLPLWLLGVLGQKIMRQGKVSSKFLASMLFIFSILLLCFAKKYMGFFTTNMYQTFSLTQEVDNLCYFTLIGAGVLLNILAMHGLLADGRLLPESVANLIRWGAGGSFTLYLVHLPILVLVSGILAPAIDSVIVGLSAAVLVFAFGLSLSLLAERRKKVFAGIFARIFLA
ncbi:MAG: acyltransferase [Alphaproteobacteria bacterium]|nr:acyltransferase [Alphaproteobacteria bacterium]